MVNTNKFYIVATYSSKNISSERGKFLNALQSKQPSNQLVLIDVSTVTAKQVYTILKDTFGFVSSTGLVKENSLADNNLFFVFENTYGSTYAPYVEGIIREDSSAFDWAYGILEMLYPTTAPGSPTPTDRAPPPVKQNWPLYGGFALVLLLMLKK
ncbi:MAG: hypothetical protein M3Q56_11410 [Bacteroidota bacterium]|nr:hypothetical protein [Bacteroidota bacterium]